MAVNRRAFLKSSFAASVFALGAPAVLLGSITPQLKRTSAGITGLYAVLVSQHTVLNNTYGCLRITIPSMPNLGGILVTRISATAFTAVSEICPHQGCSVNLFNASQKYFLCPCHRSTFKSDGSVISGPASRALASYVTTYDGADTVSIEIPGLVGVGENTPTVAEAFTFSPNPVSAAGTLTYSLNEAATVVVGLHDITGREIARISEGRRAAGLNSEHVDVTTLRPGTYFVRVAVNGTMIDAREIAVVR